MATFDDVLEVAAARVEEQARGQRADEDRGGDRQQDAGGHENERERIDLHDGEMVGPRAGAEVGPKVTTLLGRRRFLAAVGLLIASACAPAATKAAAPTPAMLPTLGADPRNGVWPAQYLRAAAPVREAYSWAIAHEPTLRYIPCYCGCGEDGHTSNYSCYVQQVLAGGRVILDPHGFG
jgi:Protein of unknown function with PCYCGC motif